MPSKLRVRYIFGPLVKSIAKGCIKFGMTPNIATMTMLLFSILSFFSLVLFSNILLFSILVFITGILDGVDGAIAKFTGNSTKKGGFLDSSMDRVSEFNIFLALLVFLWNESIWMVDMKLIIFISFLASIMVSYTRNRAENFCKGDFNIGMMARSERLFYLVVVGIIACFFGIYFFNACLFIYMWLVSLTALFRFIKFKKIIEEIEKYII